MRRTVLSIEEVAGVPVEYFAAGSGPGLVLLHGTSMDAQTNFAHLVDGFSDVRTVVRPNFPGSGSTPLPSAGALSVELLANQVSGLIEALDLGPVDLVGFSLGGVVAAALAARAPDRVRSLTVAAGWADSSEPRIQLGFAAWARAMDVAPELAGMYGPLLAFSPKFLREIGAGGIEAILKGESAPGTRAQVALSQAVDIADDPPRIAAPTLVIGCEQDYLVPREHAFDLHTRIAGSQYVELPGGHVVTAEQPAAFTSAVREFVTRHPR